MPSSGLSGVEVIVVIIMRAVIISKNYVYPRPSSERFSYVYSFKHSLWRRFYYYHHLQMGKLRHRWAKRQNLDWNPSDVTGPAWHDHDADAHGCNLAMWIWHSLPYTLNSPWGSFSLVLSENQRMPLSFLSNSVSFLEPPSMENELDLDSSSTFKAQFPAVKSLLLPDSQVPHSYDGNITLFHTGPR